MVASSLFLVRGFISLIWLSASVANSMSSVIDVCFAAVILVAMGVSSHSEELFMGVPGGAAATRAADMLWARWSSVFGFTVDYLVLLIFRSDFFVNVSLVVESVFVLCLSGLFVCVAVEVAPKGS